MLAQPLCQLRIRVVEALAFKHGAAERNCRLKGKALYLANSD